LKKVETNHAVFVLYLSLYIKKKKVSRIQCCDNQL